MRKSMSHFLAGWFEDVHQLVEKAPRLRPDAACAEQVARVLRSAATTGLFDYETQQEALYQAQRLFPLEEDVLQGPQKIAEYRWEQLRERMEFDRSYYAIMSVGRMEDLRRDEAAERAGVAKYGPFERKVCSGYRTETLDTTQYEDDYDY